MSGADLTDVDTWLFDLDNTLYPHESGLAELSSERITDFMEELTGLPRDEARALQKRYLAEEGLTLGGLIRHHGVDPDHYHARFHDLPLEGLARDGDLRAGLARLPGRRLVFTNADEIHTRRVLAHLDLADLFDDIFHIGSAAFVPKPSPAAFAALAEAHAIVAGRTAFFEDSERNLEPAAALGMTTILVGPSAESSVAPFVHYRARHLAPFLAAARVKGDA